MTLLALRLDVAISSDRDECLRSGRLTQCLTGVHAARLSYTLLTSRRRRTTLLGGKSYLMFHAKCLVKDVSQHGRVIGAHDTVSRRLERLRKCTLRVHATLYARRQASHGRDIV